MEFIIAVCHGEYTEGVDYALVEISAERAKQILEQHRLYLEIAGRGGPFVELDAVYFSDWSPAFFDMRRLGDEGETQSDTAAGVERDLLTAEQRVSLEENRIIAVDAGFTLHGEDVSVKTYSESLVIRADQFGWTACLEYTGERIQTVFQPYELLNRLL